MTEVKPHLFKSPHLAFRVSIRPQQLSMHPITGQLIAEVPRMVAEFGVHGDEFTMDTPDGRTETFGDIRGGYYDLDADAEEKGWTDEEKEAARERLLRLCKSWPGAIQVVEPYVPTAPFPTYDLLHEDDIAGFSHVAGLLREAYDYEKATQNRETVLAQITEKLEGQAVEDELVSA